MVRMKLGLYCKRNQVHDGEVEFGAVSIEGPNGKLQHNLQRNSISYKI